MAQLLKISAWNANVLCQHKQEIKFFIQTFNLGILLVSETHFINRSYITTPNYNLYYANHPDERAQGRTAVIIRQNIKGYVTAGCRQENIQATSIAIEDSTGETTVSAIYFPLQHHNKYNNYDRFFKTTGNRFIPGDYNTKNPFCVSRLATTKRKEMNINNLKNLSTTKPPTGQAILTKYRTS